MPEPHLGGRPPSAGPPPIPPSHTIAIDVYYWTQTSAGATPTPATTGQYDYFSVVIADTSGNLFNQAGYETPYGFTMNQDSNNTSHYTFKVTTDDLPDPAVVIVYYNNPTTKSRVTVFNNGGAALDYSKTVNFTYVFNASKGGGSAASSDGSQPPPSVNGSIFDMPPSAGKSAPNIIQGIHDLVWGILGEVTH